MRRLEERYYITRTCEAVPYERYQEAMRKAHHIAEGQTVVIRHAMPGIEVGGAQKKVKCKVARIDRFFITLRFPKGWEQSFLWQDFENERLPN